MASAFETKATIATFGGKLLKLSHKSNATQTPMDVNLYLPPASNDSKVPVLIFLSGLTCTPNNCSEKGFFHAAASKAGLAVLYPDTSPRGADLPGEKDSWDFGEGAGFYVNATAEPWKKHYKMETYVTQELPEAVFGAYGDKLDRSRVSITGHSMGGHGALTLFLKNPGMYRSVSALAPICNPSQCPWGEKAFGGYFGQDGDAKALWAGSDATELVRAKLKSGEKLPCLIDVGTGDNFYNQKQLLLENFEKAVKETSVEGVTVRYQPDYDHSYFFISSFAEDHVQHAAKYLL
ncbi:S-formylglutathione hydrolase [Apiospora hydei]|uniref:S-formylglutathione hydrolase n=1 Tax=Apiospora hydei TaxID=1337664 RepID=A0ABR1X020_9PEZI